MTRFAMMAVFAAMMVGPARAQAPAQHDHDQIVKGGGALPAGWQARLDTPEAKLDTVKFVTMGTGLHATTGPAGIFYQPASTMKAPFAARASFTQTKPSAHPEAYGLIIGGSDLNGPKQKYTYFMIRQDGKFLIKRRAGEDTANVMDWTDHAAVKKGDATGKMTNTLAIEAGKDKVRFLVNDLEVASLPATTVDTGGIVGVRINHNLDVHIGGFGVKSGTS